MDRAAQFAVVTAREAVHDSGLDFTALDPVRTGVTIGSAVGATTGLDQEYRTVSDGGRLDLVDHRYAVPHLYNFLVPSSFATEVAWAVGAEGPGTVVSTGCTSGLDAVGHAAGVIRDGLADVMVAGATDAPISPITVACFDAIKATTPATTTPNTPPVPSTPAATVSSSVRAPPSSSWRSCPAHGGVVPTSMPRWPVTPPGPTPST